MAKKAKKKAVKRGKAKKAPASRATSRAPRTMTVKIPHAHRRPKPTPLPGMENLGRDQVLDEVCSRATDRRESRKSLREEESSDKQLAATRMQKLGWTTYNRNGSVIKRVSKGEAIEFAKGGDAEDTTTADASDIDEIDLDNGSEEEHEEEALAGANA